MKGQELLEKAVQWAKTKGYSAIRADLEGYDSPTSFRKSDDEDVFTPDVTGKKLGTKSYIEISLKSRPGKAGYFQVEAPEFARRCKRRQIIPAGSTGAQSLHGKDRCRLQPCCSSYQYITVTFF